MGYEHEEFRKWKFTFRSLQHRSFNGKNKLLRKQGTILMLCFLALHAVNVVTCRLSANTFRFENWICVIISVNT